MLSELRVFDNIPRYLLSPDAELKRRALSLLIRELERREVRRPWGSIEPFIVALYHVVFVDRDVEIGKLLLNYLNRVLPKVKNTLPIEVQEAADIILYAVRAEIGEIDKNSALRHIQDYKTTSLILELIKSVAIAELRGEYDEQLDELLRKISNSIEQKLWYLKTLLEEPAFRDIVEHFFLDLDAAQLTEEPRSTYTIRSYFIHRAKELQKEYKERRKIIDSIKAEYEELKQRYNEIVMKLSKMIERWLPIIINIVVSAIAGLSVPFKSVLISGGISALVFVVIFAIVKQLHNIINPYISKIALKIAKRIARYTREGRNVIRDIKDKEKELKDLEVRLRKLR
jgi:hypothetical protein